MRKVSQLTAEQVDFIVYLKNDMGAKLYGTRMVVKCPLHAEKSPSFVIDTKRLTFRCLGCNQRGTLDELKALLKKPTKKKEKKEETVATTSIEE